jgi:hypothetical protein
LEYAVSRSARITHTVRVHHSDSISQRFEWGHAYPYMEISDRIRTRMTIHGFWLTVYTPYVRSKPYIHRTWTVFAGGAGFDSQR